MTDTQTTEPTEAPSTDPSQVKKYRKMADLKDDELANLLAVYALRGDPADNFNKLIVEREIARRSANAAAGLSDLRQWASNMTQPKVKAPTVVEEQEPPTEDEIPVAPSVRDRPKDLHSMVGQEKLVNQLKMVIAGAHLRGVPMVHCLLVGPAGHGKTSLAAVIAQELDHELVCANTMMLKKASDLIGLIVKAATKPTVIFLDEIHNLPASVQEATYSVMEDGKVDIMAGSGMDATAYTKEVPNIVIVGATTRPGLLAAPFKQRFGFVGQVDSYEDEQLAEMVRRGWKRVGFEFAPSEPIEVAKRAHGIPRRALTLAERVLDFASVMSPEHRIVEEGWAAQGLAIFGIDERGLEENDYAILDCLVNKFAGKTVGLDVLSVALDIDAKTISEDHEPYLLRSNLIARTKSGRMALPAAYDLMEERAAA